MMNSMPEALDHLLVLDLSNTIGGQYCARLLADFGAEVVLVEPADGSPIRRQPPFSEDGLSWTFWHLNTSKRSIRLDGADADLTGRLGDLVARADVVVLPPGADAEAFAAHNRAAVIVSLSAFGSDGPLADWEGPEIVLQALSGMMYNNGEFGREPLFGVGNRASFAAGLAAYIGTLAALFERTGSGFGQVITIDSAETAAAMCFPYVVQHIYNDTVRSRADLAIPAGQVLCQGGWVCIWIYNHRWAALIEAVGLPELAIDPRFAEPAKRRENWTTLFEIFQDKLGPQDAEEVVDRLQKAQIIAAKAYRPAEQFENKHLKARDYWQSADGRPVLGTPFRLTASPRRTPTAVPELGEADGVDFGAAARAVPAGAAPARPPLEGLRVIEVTTAWAGPMAGRVLGFLGAQSIHVEAPNRVNSWRLNHDVPNPVNFPDRDPGARPFDRSFLFNSQNVNKLSCILNLKTEEGRETLRKLAAKADVLLCNFRPGTLSKLGVGYETLREIKPDIIVAELPAYGISGPMAGYAALGPTMEMATGMSAMIGYRGGRPENTGPSYLDPIGGFNTAASVLTALIHRQRTGEGQYIELPQVEAAMQFIGAELLSAIETGTDPELDGNRVAHAAPHDAYRAAGTDEWVAIAALDEAQFRALCQEMGRPELADDPRFSSLEQRRANADALDAEITAWTRDIDKHEIAERLQRAGVAAASVETSRDIAHSPYLAHRAFFTELEHPDAGRHRYPSLPMHLSRTPGGQWSAAPTFGGHNRHVLERILELPDEEIRIVTERAMADVPLPGV
jgi:crotonobetainyl-CoA:carnitine CoA-transferase CaiB-like acyl-CoA transferase